MGLEYLDITTDTFKRAGVSEEQKLIAELMMLLAESEQRIQALEEGDGDELV